VAESSRGPLCGRKGYVNANSSDTIGNRNRCLLACSAVPQQRHRALSFALYSRLTSVLFRSTCNENNCWSSYILLRVSRCDDVFNQSKITCFQTHYNTSLFSTYLYRKLILRKRRCIRYGISTKSNYGIVRRRILYRDFGTSPTVRLSRDSRLV
jgi:hypothetical protein